MGHPWCSWNKQTMRSDCLETPIKFGLGVFCSGGSLGGNWQPGLEGNYISGVPYEQKAKLSRHKICLRRFRVACFAFFPQERYSEAPKTITPHDVQLALRASILHCVSLFLPQAVSCHDSSCQCSSAMHGGQRWAHPDGSLTHRAHAHAQALAGTGARCDLRAGAAKV